MNWKGGNSSRVGITSREMKVLLFVASATHFFGISINGHKGDKHHNHKPCRNKANLKPELRRGRVSTRSKLFRRFFGEQYDSYKRSQFTRNKRRQKVSQGKRKEMISELNTEGGKFSKPLKPSHDQPYHAVGSGGGGIFKAVGKLFGKIY